MKTQIFATRKEFNARPNKSINGVSPAFAAEHPDYEVDNETNDGCWNCRKCRSCHDCYNCRRCRYSIDCHNCGSCHYCLGCLGCRRCEECCNGQNLTEVTA